MPFRQCLETIRGVSLAGNDPPQISTPEITQVLSFAPVDQLAECSLCLVRLRCVCLATLMEPHDMVRMKNVRRCLDGHWLSRLLRRRNLGRLLKSEINAGVRLGDDRVVSQLNRNVARVR